MGKFRVSVDATQVSDDCDLLAATNPREMKSSCKGWGGEWSADPGNLTCFTVTEHIQRLAAQSWVIHSSEPGTGTTNLFAFL